MSVQNLIDVINCQSDGRYAKNSAEGMQCKYSPDIDCKYRISDERTRIVEFVGVQQK